MNNSGLREREGWLGGGEGDGDVVRIRDAVTTAARTESTGSIKNIVCKTRTTYSAELPGVHLGLGINSTRVGHRYGFNSSLLCIDYGFSLSLFSIDRDLT